MEPTTSCGYPCWQFTGWLFWRAGILTLSAKFERWFKVSDVINGGLLFESCGDLQILIYIYQHQSQSRLEHPSWSMYFCLSDPKQGEFQWTIVLSFLSSVVNMSMPQNLRYNEKKSTIFRRLWHIFVVCSFLKDVFQEKGWMSVGISAKEAMHSDVFWRQSLKNWFKYKNHQEPPSNLACWHKRLSSSPRPSKASRFFNMSPVHSFYLWRASGSLSVCLHKRPSFDLSLSWWNIGPMGMVYLPTNLPYTSAKCR